jgi:anti-sigma regulatory factor (Ser/Thr protein kinase)
VERSAGRVRQFLRDILDPDHAALADLRVCACELVNNGLRHTKSGQGGRIAIKLAQTTSAFRIEVTDDGAGGARSRLRQPDAESGRGRHIVDALTVRWGYIPVGDRTTSWAELACGALLRLLIHSSRDLFTTVRSAGTVPRDRT